MHSLSHATHRLLLTALLVVLAVPSLAKESPKVAAKPAPGATRSMMMTPIFAGLPGDLPKYVEPGSYSVDLVVNAEGQDFVMKRSIDGGRIRTEFDGSGQSMVMIELGDDAGTMYTLMPKEKRAIKQSRTAMMALAEKHAPKAAQAVDAAAPSADVKVEDLGDETINGIAAKKLRFVTPQGAALAWFDKSNGAPVRMESNADGHKSSMEWRNFKPGPQPAALFEVPKKYEVTDMDEMMSQMTKMQGQGGMNISGLMGGAGGMAGMGGGLDGIAGSMGQNFVSSMGSSFGGSLGAAFGGPIGAIAGQYIGGKVGGMIGKKAAEIVTPGK